MERAAFNQEFSLLLCDTSVIQKPRRLLCTQGKLRGVQREKTRIEFKIKDQCLASSNTTTFCSGLSCLVYQQTDITSAKLLNSLGGVLTGKPGSVPSFAFDFLCRLWQNTEFGASGCKDDTRRIQVPVRLPDNVCRSCRYPFDIHAAFYILVRPCHLWSSVITELLPIDFKTSMFLLFPFNSKVDYHLIKN